MMAGLAQDYEGMSEAINARLLTGAGDDVRERITRDASRIPRTAALRVIEASLMHDPLPALERYDGPKLAVITPDGDTPDDIHRLLPDVQHVMIDGTSHWIQLDKPEAFNRIVDRFLEGVDPR
jgi:pimeloyl-ACP methyl ester carboxylesterase